MQIGSVGSAPQVAATAKAPESVEGPGPDHDGDADDAAGVAKSATAPGVGTVVDKTV